jgi:hypothetical protein
MIVLIAYHLPSMQSEISHALQACDASEASRVRLARFASSTTPSHSASSASYYPLSYLTRQRYVSYASRIML